MLVYKESEMRDEKESTVVHSGLNITSQIPTIYQDDEVKVRTAPDIIEAILATLTGIKTVYDYGCGRGVYVQAFEDAGVECTGYDSNREATGHAISQYVFYADVGKARTQIPNDLMFSIEVAEHIDPTDLDTFIGNLTSLSKKWIVFTGSNKPHSPGHVNPQSNEYWRKQVVSRGTHKYRPDLSQIVMDKCKTIIGRPSCLRWFQENLQVFERIESDNKT